MFTVSQMYRRFNEDILTERVGTTRAAEVTIYGTDLDVAAMHTTKLTLDSKGEKVRRARVHRLWSVA